jgi:hypothetical protein
MGIVGAVLVAVWAKGLIGDTGKVLLDREMDHPVVNEIREVVEAGPDGEETPRITDSARLARGEARPTACALTVVTHDPCADSRTSCANAAFGTRGDRAFATIEIHHCTEVSATAVAVMT